MSRVYIRSTPETENLSKEELMSIGGFTDIGNVVLKLFREGASLCTRINDDSGGAGWVGDDEDSEAWLLSRGYAEVFSKEEVLI